MVMNARLSDDDLYRGAEAWHEIERDVEALAKMRDGADAEKLRRGISGRMYRSGIDIPLLISEIQRLRQYVPKDKRYPDGSKW